MKLAPLLLLAASCAPALQSPVMVLMRDGRPACSAFAVGPHAAMTAAHCVAGGVQIRAVTRPQWERSSASSVAFRVELIDHALDVAVLVTDETLPVYVTTAEPKQGQACRAVSAVYDWSVSDGLCFDPFGAFLTSSISVQRGWSGSPVFDTEGRAVALVSSCQVDPVSLAGKPQCQPKLSYLARLPHGLK